MIEAEGVKIAENSDEAYWKNLYEETIKRITAMKREIIIHEAVGVLCLEKMADSIKPPTEEEKKAFLDSLKNK